MTSDRQQAIVKSRVLAEEVKSGVFCCWNAFHQPPNVGVRIRHDPGYENCSERADDNMGAFSQPVEARSLLDQIVQQGSQRMLQAAIEADSFLEQHSSKRDDRGRRLVVRNGRLPDREVMTGAGKLAASQPWVRDKSTGEDDRVHFSPKVLLPNLRRSQSIDDLIPWLYLKGVSTGDFRAALQSLVGEAASGLSANTIVRLKESWSAEYDAWCRRSLDEKHYVYVWADGIHVNVRLEDEARKRQCTLVLMGATTDGKKELLAVADGYRESEQNWHEVLIDLKQRGRWRMLRT